MPRPAAGNRFQIWQAPALCFAALCATACAGGPTPLQLPTIASLGEMPKLEIPKLEAPKLTIEPSLIQASSAEIYTRVARGAMACWFGGQGRLTGSYIFHADAAPAMNGGAVEIVVHERAVDQPKPWGYKAFRVQLAETTGLDGASGSGGTRITVDNLRMPEAEAPRMRAEVFKWAVGTEGCSEGAPAPVAAAVAPPAVAPAKKALVLKAKAKPKAAAPPPPGAALATTPPAAAPDAPPASPAAAPAASAGD